MNVEKMKAFMREHNLSPNDMAEAAGINVATWFRKVNRDGDTITVREMNAIINAFEISKAEAAEIFFNEKLA
jgi:predicted transcriptional regulator